jgi:glycosyltransferase involved in cell wall biosynthesis
MREHAYDCHLICSPSEYLEDYAREQKIGYAGIPITRKITPVQDLKSLFAIAKYIQHHKIDIIVGHTPKGALLAMLSGVIMRVSIRIYFRHGLLNPERVKGITFFLFITMERFISFLATKIVCVSPSLADLSLKLRLNKASKQCVLGRGTCGGIDTIHKYNPGLINPEDQDRLRKSLNIDQNTFIVGYCGRLVNDKGIRELVDGFQLLREKHPDRKIKLLLVGFFDERDFLDTVTQQEIVNNNHIIITGYIKDNLPLYYSLMTVCILPSYREGFGMCMLEAQAMQIPVLTTRSFGCINSIIENKTGFFVDITPDGICDGIERYFDGSLRERIGKEGRKMVVEHFDNYVIWPEIEKLYAEG